MTRLDQKTVANRYARAIFELAASAGQLEPVHQELTQLRQVLDENPGLAPLLSGVQLSLAEKQKLVDQLKQGASTYVANLVQMVFDYHRMNDLAAIVAEFNRRFDAKDHRVHAQVTTAVALDDKRRGMLQERLATRLGAKEVVLNERVDPAILGGVVVKTPTQTLDGSLSTKLAQIRRLLVK